MQGISFNKSTINESLMNDTLKKQVSLLSRKDRFKDTQEVDNKIMRMSNHFSKNYQSNIIDEDDY